MWKTVLALLPAALRTALAAVPPHIADRAEEIRIREGRPLEVCYAGGFVFVTASGAMTDDPRLGLLPNREDCLKLLDAATNHSLYTMEEQLRRGFITVKGGHRIGLAGRAVTERGSVRGLKEIGGFNIRIAKEVKGAAEHVLPHLWNKRRNALYSTLIVSPPQRGKTTLLRDLARTVGKRSKVGIVDERSEIAACLDGVPSFDVGPRTDVLDSCPKAEGIMMMIRSLSPEVIIVDEIGREEDAAAVLEALHAGISIVSTAHGYDLSDVRSRPTLSALLASGAFERIVSLRPAGPPGSIFSVVDGRGAPVDSSPPVSIGARR
ncbi:stage III sporulation protein AA [Paenibacillus thermotolerans]|uniref:stage III sporulation protein AA n=1 Tax=Paenibacillus thermotolerans TaxID=3027807 RepID=UPI002367B4A2|nr:MULTISPECIES: stage III sporulation protein AA [unclassified Paenibacillus]